MNGTQSKMARAALGLSTHDLAALAGVGRITVARFEGGDTITPENIGKLQQALEQAGAAFVRRSGRVGVTVAEIDV
ncbi:MAG: helix-turn-helix transcriptional regulator [Croceibacterium sp.]